MRFEQKNDKLEEWLWNCAVKFTPGTWVLTESWTSSQQQLAQHCSTLGLPGRSQGTMLLIPERWKTCSVEMCQQKNSLAIILANPQPKPKPRYQVGESMMSDIIFLNFYIWLWGQNFPGLSISERTGVFVD